MKFETLKQKMVVVWVTLNDLRLKMALMGEIMEKQFKVMILIAGQVLHDVSLMFEVMVMKENY